MESLIPIAQFINNNILQQQQQHHENMKSPTINTTTLFHTKLSKNQQSFIQPQFKHVDSTTTTTCLASISHT